MQNIINFFNSKLFVLISLPHMGFSDFTDDLARFLQCLEIKINQSYVLKVDKYLVIFSKSITKF